MAIRHGLAGQFCKAEHKKRNRQILAAFVALTFTTSVATFLWGFFWNRLRGWFVLLPLAAFAVVLKIVVGRVEPWIDRVAKERIKFLRGGQAEALVAWILQDLEDDWHIFNNLKLESGSDVDHVVVGPNGLFCISTKSHRGLFTGTVDGLIHNNDPCDFAKQAMGQTLELRTRLEALMGANAPWVQPVLAVPFGFTKGDACNGKVWLVHQDSIINRIAPENGAPRLNNEQLERILKVLMMLEYNGASVYQSPLAAIAK